MDKKEMLRQAEKEKATNLGDKKQAGWGSSGSSTNASSSKDGTKD